MLVGQTIGDGDRAIAIERELGSGAMGSVYRARLLKDDRIVALKIISFGLADNEQARARFEREGKILKQLKHPNITRLYATGQYRKTPFFAMEYVDGESLDKLFERRGKLPWESIVQYGIQLCSALEHAHEKGIVHRDLKPSNIMVAKDGLTVKLTDFGIAKDVDLTALTGANNTIGTAAYMSPEQCRGEKTLGPKSDIYSLGVVFYELVTGRKPFVKESAIDLFMAHVNDSFERPSRLVPNLPMWLDTLICQMMEKRPEMRPLDAGMVGRSLEEIAEKVATHKSVGLEVANARVIDRIQMTAPPDETDRDASRVIRSSAKRKKFKKKAIPIYRKLWFSLSLIALLLVGIGFGIFQLTKSPDPKIAFKAAMDEKDDERREQLLTAYSKRNESNKDADWQAVRDELLNLKAKKSDQAMWRRVMLGMRKPDDDYDPKAYELVLKGYKSEGEGDLKGAADTWRELADGWSKKETEALSLWGWIGKRHIALIKEADDQEKKIRDKRETAKIEEEEPTFDSDNAKLVYEALRYEEFGDPTKAKAKWKSLKEDREKDKPLDQRIYLVLAARHFRELEPKKDASPEEREKLVKAKLADALSRQASDNLAVLRIVRNQLRDIRDLYKNDIEPLAKLAEQAEAELKKGKP